MQILRGMKNHGEKCPLFLVTPKLLFLSDGYCPVVFNAICTFALLILACGVAVFVTK